MYRARRCCFSPGTREYQTRCAVEVLLWVHLQSMGRGYFSVTNVLASSVPIKDGRTIIRGTTTAIWVYYPGPSQIRGQARFGTSTQPR